MLILLIFCFYMTLNFGFRIRDCYETRDYYWKAKRLKGKMLYWEKRIDFLHWYSFPVYYYMEIQADNRYFRIVTDNPDAEKYGTQEDIVILKGLIFTEKMRIKYPEHFQPKTEEERQNLEKAIEIAKDLDKAMENHPPIIEEDQKGILDLIGLYLLAFGFGALTVIAVMILLKPYR